MDYYERAKGSLVGLATGDALGTTVEFKAPGTFMPLTDIVGGGPFNLKAGQWTDDTSTALCLGDSLLEKLMFSPTDQLNKYLRWHNDGYRSSTGKCFDIGISTISALQNYQKHKKPLGAPSDWHLAGNGSLMRLSPLVLFYFRPDNVNMKRIVELSMLQSKTTHGEIRAVQACGLFAVYLARALSGATKGTVLSALTNNCMSSHYLTRERAHKDFYDLLDNYHIDKKFRPEGTGFVVDSLNAALWCFANSDSFKQGALLAANLGNDADTTAAIYGQLAGAFYGLSGIPIEWRNILYQEKDIQGIACALACADNHRRSPYELELNL